MRDPELLQEFESGTLAFELYRQHVYHVRIAYLLLQRDGFELALQNMRRCIKVMNERNEVPEGPRSGYNETTTHALLWLIHVVMRGQGEAFPVADSAAFFDTHPQLHTKHILRLFYSPERRLDPRAKAEFLEPDLGPLPLLNA
ncbi:MAG: hypothetical protein ACPG31_00105 [Planctomycetota bacterium]